MTDQEEREQAFATDPIGETCSHCGAPNDLFDDIGWFYKYDSVGRLMPACMSCHGPLTGDR